MAVHAGADPRTTPLVKGPDLEALAAVKAAAFAACAADEVLLVDTDGVALEAAYSALAWWEDDTLCFPPSGRPFLPSVTARLLRQLASAQGVPVAERARSAAELTTYETWLLSALHGIRPVHAWNHGPIDPLPASTATSWQSRLESLARPL